MSSCAFSSLSTEPPPVVVVGAGLAGLHWAWRLHRAGVAVVVLEARDRVGGRTWSQSLDDGTVIERGGEFIGPDDDVIRSLVAELELELIRHGFSFDRRATPEHAAPTSAELDELATWAGARIEVLTDDVSVLDALGPADEWTSSVASALRRLETSLTVPLSQVSARRMFTGEPTYYDPAVRVRGGNQARALELARRLGERVRFSWPVAVVRRSEAAAAVVVAADGHEATASAVVLALPLPLLLELDLEPRLPDEVRAVVARAPFGNTAAKFHVPLASSPAPGAMASADARWWCWTSQADDDPAVAAPVLSCFADGRAAIDAFDAEAALALRPDIGPAAGEPLVTDWGAEPWTRGSYSVPGVGVTDADDAAWQRPFGTVVLAGEHTAGRLAGTMNGATASGARAAATVLDLLGVGA